MPDHGRAEARGTLGGALMECYDVGDSVHCYRIRAEARKIGRTALFGMSTKECGRNTHNGKAISWIMQTSRRTVCLSNLENLNAHFVSGDRGSAERLLKLNLIAIHQVTFPWRIRLFDPRGR